MKAMWMLLLLLLPLLALAYIGTRSEYVVATVMSQTYK